MIFRKDILKAYNIYKKLIPLDIETKGGDISIWQKEVMLDVLDFSRTVAEFGI